MKGEGSSPGRLSPTPDPCPQERARLILAGTTRRQPSAYARPETARGQVGSPPRRRRRAARSRCTCRRQALSRLIPQPRCPTTATTTPMQNTMQMMMRTVVIPISPGRYSDCGSYMPPLAVNHSGESAVIGKVYSGAAAAAVDKDLRSHVRLREASTWAASSKALARRM